MLNESSYPDEEKGNVIIAGHSGNYFNSYFGNLWKLSIGDVAYINYKNVKYEYKIVNIYTEAKDGDVLIRRNPEKSLLILTMLRLLSMIYMALLNICFFQNLLTQKNRC